MKTLIGGAVAAVLGLIGLSVWFGGGLALYLGFDELKDSWKKDDAPADTGAADDDSEKYKKEIDDLKKEIETLKSEK